MCRKMLICLCLAMICCCPTASCIAEMDITVKAEFELESALSDLKLSRDGKWMYLLTQEGQLLVYSYKGVLVGAFDVGAGFTQIEPGPTEDEIYLLDKKGKTIQIAELNYPREIDSSGSPFKGKVDAPVVIVEYTDFQCPYCAKLGTIFNELLELYPGKLKIVYKNFPLSGHTYAWKAAAAVMAAHEKGQFWPFHDRLFEHFNSLDDAKLLKIRKEFGFDTPEFDQLMKSSKIRKKVADDKQEGKSIGVHSTPTVFVNGIRLKDKRLSGFKAAIDKALEALSK
jgi:protein-disulfide isomerase